MSGDVATTIPSGFTISILNVSSPSVLPSLLIGTVRTPESLLIVEDPD